MVNTTPNSALLAPLSCMAASMNTVATTPESVLTRIGVPSLGWKRPKNPPKKEPSAAAIACMRSLMIIQAAPWDTSTKQKTTAETASMASAAGPNTVKTVATAPKSPPMPVIWSSGTTSRMARIGSR